MEAIEGNTFITHHVWILSKIWLGVHAEELGMGHTESHFEILPLPTCKQKFNQKPTKEGFQIIWHSKNMHHSRLKYILLLHLLQIHTHVLYIFYLCMLFVEYVFE